jgi:ABC-type polysaccharide/polyol phosphate export permease
MADTRSAGPLVRTIDTTGRAAMPSRARLALDDLEGGLARWWVWHAMAWEDIRLRYRGSILGPFWLTLSMAIMIATLGLVYSTIFKTDIRRYLPFLTLGLLFWTFISSILTEGCNCLIGAEAIIRQVRMPFTTHVCRTLYRNLIVLGHNAVVFLFVAWWFAVPLGGRALLVLPGIALLLLNGVWVCFLLGMLCARFRDIVPIVANVIQIVFFTTPILWQPGSLGGRFGWIVAFNPFYAALEIVRGPLLGEPVTAGPWIMMLAVAAAGSAATFAFFARFRSRIPFWV